MSDRNRSIPPPTVALEDGWVEIEFAVADDDYGLIHMMSLSEPAARGLVRAILAALDGPGDAS